MLMLNDVDINFNVLTNVNENQHLTYFRLRTLNKTTGVSIPPPDSSNVFSNVDNLMKYQESNTGEGEKKTLREKRSLLLQQSR